MSPYLLGSSGPLVGLRYVEVRIIVGPDDAIQEIHATWGGASSRSYRLSFSGLGSTPAPTVPDNVESLCVLRGIPCPPPTPGG
jgi:hypothetical protein